MQDPILTIIIPTFNSSATLKATLDSILQQRFERVECWIIDGGSSDTTIALIEKFSAAHSFIKYISEPDKGIYDAMNKGILLAKGDYLYFMGSDDVFYQENVLSGIFSLPDFETYDLIYGNIIFKHSGLKEGEEKNYLKLIRNLENINHQAIFYSRRVFNKIGLYDLNFPIYADFNLNVKCFKEKTLSAKYVDMVICVFNERGASYFQRNRDSYIHDLHELYVAEYEDKVALYATSRFLEKRLDELLNSRDYRVGKKVGNVFRVLRRAFKRISK
ncbi:glycosyltransferase family 2 protein [Flavitalea flava]